MILERKDQIDRGAHVALPGGGTMDMTPPIDESYWRYRVRLSEGQSVLGFPKFSTIGIGFEQEEDWNTNLPYTCSAEEIADHIGHNKGDDSIPDADVLQAIRLIQEAATADRSVTTTDTVS